jgi:phosphoribosyl 1,2-cyclic phosphodiesterase
MAERLALLGVALDGDPDDLGRSARASAAAKPFLRVDAIIPTHRHGDHFGQIERLARALQCPIWLHRGIDGRALAKHFPVHAYEPGRPFRVGDLEILAERVPHDAPHVALRLATANHAIGVATDVGHVTRGLISLLASCDAALVESNHCEELLAWGPYPQRLKERVAGGYGHLSNAHTAELASRLVGSRLGRIWLGHLSRSNNTPERALDVVASRARRIDVEVLPHGAVCALDVRLARPTQLGLFQERSD